MKRADVSKLRPLVLHLKSLDTKKGGGVLPKPLSNHCAFPHPEAEVAFQHVQTAAA